MILVTIQNDGTGTLKRGNYDWEVRLNADRLAKGRVMRFERALGWEALLRRVAEEAEK